MVPQSVELGRLPNSDLYRDATRFGTVDLLNGVRVFRFDAPLLFANIDLFKKRAQKLASEAGQYPTIIRALVVDGSGIICIDCMGVNTLKEFSLEMAQRNVIVYLASFKAPVREMCQSVGFDKKVLRFYPSVHDAIHCALSEASMEGDLLGDKAATEEISHM
uniref:STAS domain-containing protein n=1 Tax=Plectus sambesii TaxID=2011161 RepID=A0A914XM08_9BILA